MSSDGSWHLLYYSLSDSTSLSCCTQPGGFNSRWLIQETTFSLLPHPTIPLPSQFQHTGNPGSPELTSLPVPAGGLPRAATRSWGLPCRHTRDTTVILQRLVQNQAEFSARCYTWPCTQCWTEPLLFPAALGCVQEASLCLPKNKETKIQQKKSKPQFPHLPIPPSPALWDRESMLQWNESNESVFFWALFSNVTVSSKWRNQRSDVFKA